MHPLLTGVELFPANQRKLQLNPVTPSAPQTTMQPGKVVSSAQHFSQLVYAVPSERARALLPAELRAHQFELAKTQWAGQSCCWLSVISYLDQQQPFAGVSVEEGFEVSEYRVHVQREGQPYQWVLNTSVGSLMAVGARHLWSLPWHLSASELRCRYDERQMRYQAHRLQVQSEYVNALWELHDSGTPVTDLADSQQLPSFLFNSLWHDCFLRRGGGVGTRQTRLRFQMCTHGTVNVGRCDFLTRQGWLTATEVTRPNFTRLSRSVILEQETPRLLRPAAAVPLSLSRAA